MEISVYGLLFHASGILARSFAAAGLRCVVCT